RDPTPTLHTFPTRRSSDLSHGTSLYSAEVYHPFRLELLIVGASGELEDEDKVPRTYEYSKEMFPWESVCALAAVERKRETKPNRSEEHTSELQSRVDLVCR